MSASDYNIENLVLTLNKYYTPLLIMFGIIGNTISIFIFLTSNLSFQSTALYMSALACADIMVLFQLILPWMSAVWGVTLFHHQGFCQFTVYMAYTFCCLSSWLVVAFTIERFVAVLYPLQRNRMCTLKRAKHIVIGLTIAALLFNSPVIVFTSTSNGQDCNVDVNYMGFASWFNLADTALSMTIPLAIIILLNMRIIIRMYTVEQGRRALMRVNEETGDRQVQPPCELQIELRAQNRVTRMLLTVSSAFFILNLPNYIMRILAYAYDMRSNEYKGKWAAWQQLALIFFNTNFSIGFVLYCFTGKNFQRALCQAFFRLRRWKCCGGRGSRDNNESIELRTASLRNANRPPSGSWHRPRPSTPRICAEHRVRFQQEPGNKTRVTIEAFNLSGTEAASTSTLSGLELSGEAVPMRMLRHSSEPIIQQWDEDYI